MRKNIIQVLAVCVCIIAAMCLGGCGEGSGSDGGSSNAPKFDFGCIEWGVGTSVIEGDRVVTFGYDNNSDYDIAELSLEYKLKDDVTEEEIAKYSELKEKAENMEEELSDLTISVRVDNIVEAGGSVSDIPMNLDKTIQYYTEYDAYDLFEPDIMTVLYFKGNDIYTAYYDYKSQETSYSDEVLKAFTWSDSELAKKLPKSDARIAIVGFDDETRFHVNTYGVTKEKYEEYIGQCKEAGFTKNIDNDVDWNWEAEDAEGNKVDLIYDSSSDELSIAIDAPRKE